MLWLLVFSHLAPRRCAHPPRCRLPHSRQSPGCVEATGPSPCTRGCLEREDGEKEEIGTISGSVDSEGGVGRHSCRQTVSPSIRRSLSRQLIRPSVSVLRGPTLSLSSMRQSYLHRRCTRCCRCPWRGALVAPAAPPPWYCPRFSGITRITRATCLLGRREREGGGRGRGERG